MPVRERREKPRISETPPVPPPPPNLDDYEPIIGRAELGEIRYLTAALKGKTVKMVNSTRCTEVSTTCRAKPRRFSSRPTRKIGSA